MDDSVSLYSGRYGENGAYILGFHDGLEIGLKHGREYGQDSILSKDIPKGTDGRLTTVKSFLVFFHPVCYSNNISIKNYSK